MLKDLIQSKNIEGGKFYDPENEYKQMVLINKETYKEPNLRRNVKPYIYLTEFSNREVAVFIDKAFKVIVFCYRGTDFSNVYDVLADIQIAIPSFKLSPRYLNMKRHFKETMKNFEDWQVILSGHSLGGHIASVLIGYCDETEGKDDCRFIVLNRGSSPIEFYSKSPKDYKRRNHYHMKGDWLSKTFLKDTKTKHKVLNPVSQKNPHSMFNFTDEFEK